MIVNDFKTTLEHIHPTDDNEKTYSLRLFELLLRTCTEFENVCKLILIKNGSAVDPDRMKIFHFKEVYKLLKFNGVETDLLFWEPRAKTIDPFHDWLKEDTLGWYRAYNRAKHNRSENLKDANLINVCLALGALTIVLFKFFSDRFFNPYASQQTGAGRTENRDGKQISIRRINNLFFSIRTTTIIVES